MHEPTAHGTSDVTQVADMQRVGVRVGAPHSEAEKRFVLLNGSDLRRGSGYEAIAFADPVDDVMLAKGVFHIYVAFGFGPMYGCL